MKITHFSVQGLAGRTKPVEHALLPDLNVFFGSNGSGKTSVLRLIYSALRNDVEIIRRAPFESASVSFATDAGVKVVRTITRQRVLETPAPQSQVFMTANGPITVPVFGPVPGWISEPDDGTSIQTSYLPTSRLFDDPAGGVWGGGDGSPYSEPRLDQQFLQLVTSRWVNYNNQQLAQIRALQDSGIARILTSLFEPFPATEADPSSVAFGDVTHFLERRGLHLDVQQDNFEQKYAADPGLRRIVADIQQTEEQTLRTEAPRRQVDVLLNRLVKGKEISLLDGGIQVQVESGTIGVDALSAGEKHLVRILIECLSAHSNCLLIDEPELSLHIDWQHELAAAMSTVNPELQIVMATHSPEVMAEVSDEKIFSL
jgi:energy-coupling factor transporter ATP-binding protein EcfA2